jgi:hypothetical protein
MSSVEYLVETRTVIRKSKSEALEFWILLRAGIGFGGKGVAW